MKIKYKKGGALSTTTCPNGRDARVGSIYCQECSNFKRINKAKQIVICRKRLTTKETK